MTDNTIFEDRIKYHYFGFGTGRVTVAYQMDNNRNNTTRKVKFGFSFCSPKDVFSKRDYKAPVYETFWSETYKKNMERISSFTIVKGGRSRAVEMLQNSPFTLTAKVKENENAVFCCLEDIEHFCYERAPSWKDKASYRKTRRGFHEISRDGGKLLVTKTGIELFTPWGGREVL